jgi:hypothetical protein
MNSDIQSRTQAMQLRARPSLRTNRFQPPGTAPAPSSNGPQRHMGAAPPTSEATCQLARRLIEPRQNH